VIEPGLLLQLPTLEIVRKEGKKEEGGRRKGKGEGGRKEEGGRREKRHTSEGMWTIYGSPNPKKEKGVNPKRRLGHPRIQKNKNSGHSGHDTNHVETISRKNFVGDYS
jgi:hypothetical protein